MREWLPTNDPKVDITSKRHFGSIWTRNGLLPNPSFHTRMVTGLSSVKRRLIKSIGEFTVEGL